MRNTFCRTAVVALFVFVAGCNHKPSGKYTAAGGAASVEFKGDKAILSSAIGPDETDDYTVDGNTITVKSKAAGDVKFTIMQDGSLEGGLGTFKKAAN